MKSNHIPTNEQIKEAYEREGGPAIDHLLTDNNRPATAGELILTGALTVAGFLVFVVFVLLFFAS